MEYTVEEISPVKRKITVTVPADEATAAIMATISLYRVNADIKGFRKGKVPSSMVESRYRSQIYQEATTDLVNYQLNEILSEIGVAPLSKLDVDTGEGELKKGEQFVYSFSFEVAPTIELPKYTGLKVDEEIPEVAEGEVDAVVERIRDNMTELEDVTEERNPADGDVVIISFTAFKDGEPFGDLKADNFELPLGEGQALEEFEAIIKGIKAGEEGENAISFPEDFINTELAGQTVDMKVKLHKIKRKVRPELDEAFAMKAGGFQSVDGLRDAIVKSYMETRVQMSKSGAQKKLLDQLLDGLDFELPDAMVQEHVDRMIQEFAQNIERQGKSMESTGKTLAGLREEYEPQARDIVRQQLFLMAVADKEGLTVNPEEVNMYLQEAAMRARQDFEVVRRYYEENNLMFAVKDKLLADRAMDLIYEAAEVNQVKAQEPGAEEAGDDAEATPKKKAASKKKAAPKKKAETDKADSAE